MKKFVVLMALLVMAGLLWAQAPAAPAAPSYPQVTLGALVQYQAAWDTGGDFDTYSDKPGVELKWTIKTDDFNTVYVELEENVESTLATNGLQPYTDRGWTVMQPIDRAYWTTDIGKALKLPVGVVAKVGFEEWKVKDGIIATRSELDNVTGYNVKKWGGQIEIAPVPVVTIRSNWAWDFAEKWFTVGGYGTVGPWAYEIGYVAAGTYIDQPAPLSTTILDTQRKAFDFDKGMIEGGLKYAQNDVSKGIDLVAAGNFRYYLDNPAIVAQNGGAANQRYDQYILRRYLTDPFNQISDWVAGAGLKVTYQKMASLDLAWIGSSEVTSGVLQPAIWAMPIKGQPLEFYALVGLALDGDAQIDDEMFDSIEASLKYTIGKSSFIVGALWSAAGGKWAKEWADFDVAGLNTPNSYPGYVGNWQRNAAGDAELGQGYDEALAIFIRFALSL